MSEGYYYEQRAETMFAGPICDHPYPVHLHNVAEIICLRAGSMALTVADSQLSLEPGDIAVIFPAIPHSYDEVSSDASGLAVIFAPEVIDEYNQAFRTMTPQHPKLECKKQPPELAAIVASFQRVCGQEGADALKRGYLHIFLSYLFKCLPLCEPSQALDGTHCEALRYISAHFTEDLSLESVARAMGISRIHLSHIFSQRLNINFRQYINMLRIDHARALLRNPAYSITQVAYLCGYGNPRTFHRAFLGRCGITPKQYRASLALKSQP